MSVKPWLRIRDTQPLLDGRDPRLDFRPPVLTQRPHPLRAGHVPEGGCIWSAEKRLLDLLGHHEQLEDPRAPAIPRAAARRASSAALEHHVFDGLAGEERD